MRERRGDLKSSGRRGFVRGVLPWFNLLIAFVLTVGLAGITTRVVETDRDADEVARELELTRATVERLRAEHFAEIDALVHRTAKERRLLEAELDRGREDWARHLDSLERRVEAVATVNRESAESATDALLAHIAAVERSVEERIASATKTPIEERFRDFERRHRDGVVLIYTEFDYHRMVDARRARRKTVVGWGSGFFATEEGHIITNKHVVQPWKFDADLAAMEALGEVEIDRDSLRITCWRAGDLALDDQGEPMTGTGLDNFAKKNLSIWAVADDVMARETIDIGSSTSTFRVHELDDHDLVVLKAEGGPFHALPMAEAPWTGLVDTLDPVMALGFPRGKKGLEGRRAVASASMGTVRKCERTIHTTASIIPGNSGGPLIGPDGTVVGVVTRIYSETLGICIKIGHAAALIERGRLVSAEKLAGTSAR